jgi:hypothetical protein
LSLALDSRPESAAAAGLSNGDAFDEKPKPQPSGVKRRDLRFMGTSNIHKPVSAFLIVAVVATPASLPRGEEQAFDAKAEEPKASDGPRATLRAAKSRKAKKPQLKSAHRTKKARSRPLEDLNTPTAPARSEETPQSSRSGMYGGVGGGAVRGADGPRNPYAIFAAASHAQRRRFSAWRVQGHDDKPSANDSLSEGRA